MTQRLKANQAITLRDRQIQVGEVFSAKSRGGELARLIASGQAQPVNVEGQTAKEAKTSRRAEKNKTRSRR